MAENSKKQWSGWEGGYDLYGLYAGKRITGELRRQTEEANAGLWVMMKAALDLMKTASWDPIHSYMTFQRMLRQIRFFPKELVGENEKEVHDELSRQIVEGLRKMKAMAAGEIECMEQILRGCHSVTVSAVALDAYWDWHETWPQSPCKEYLAGLQMRLPPPDESKPLPNPAKASKNFVEGLRQMKKLLNNHPGINSKHFDFADQLRNADIAEAEALARKLTKVKVCCPSCKAALPASLLSLGTDVQCPGCKHTFALTAPLIDEPDDALVPPPLPR